MYVCMYVCVCTGMCVYRYVRWPLRTDVTDERSGFWVWAAFEILSVVLIYWKWENEIDQPMSDDTMRSLQEIDRAGCTPRFDGNCAGFVKARA
jgi:hypothetical protein